ncbi:hypothetical protein [Bifidobacterium callitrichidarum]|uniref:Uncharacterized protein n=1 Tax=Bifidobacterium callitrichidarum TaxID=2052941 RepID=A0A2U2MZC2_9BIFI|nr:hypothetical protein [Bifidobacterium callitrichidarum]PWG62074.1 hypothetical protein DF196_12670 [Bifidobacterium callitrichidarum]
MVAKAVKAPDLGYDRWILVDDETGEILDDAQGYGYKSASGAHRAYAYKTMPNAKKKKLDTTKRRVQQFWRKHSSLADDINALAFDTLKCGEEFSDSDIIQAIEESGVDTGDLTPKQLAKYF